MERLALIMSHADRRMDGAVRELHFCSGLRRLGLCCCGSIRDLSPSFALGNSRSERVD
jgi:hypothetical protein